MNIWVINTVSGVQKQWGYLGETRVRNLGHKVKKAGFQANISVLSLNVDFRKISSRTDDDIKHEILYRYLRISSITSHETVYVN